MKAMRIVHISLAVCSALGLAACNNCVPLLPLPKVLVAPVTITLPQATDKPTGRGESYFDPNKTGTPLYDTQGHSRDKLSPYFRVSDFSHTGDVRFRFARIDAELVTCLTRLRTALSRPISVESSYRSWAYNAQLVKEGKKASTASYHMSGKAADIHVANASSAMFAQTLYTNCGCGTGLGVGKRWYHVDTRGSSVKPWGYGVKGLRLAGARRVHKQMCGGGRRDTNEVGTMIARSAQQALQAIGGAIQTLLAK